MATDEIEDTIDRILKEIKPNHIPAEFVRGACITEEDDNSYMVDNDELEELMMDEESLEDRGIVEVSLVLDLQKVRETIIHFSEIILKDVAL